LKAGIFSDTKNARLRVVKNVVRKSREGMGWLGRVKRHRAMLLDAKPLAIIRGQLNAPAACGEYVRESRSDFFFVFCKSEAVG